MSCLRKPASLGDPRQFSSCLAQEYHTDQLRKCLVKYDSKYSACKKGKLDLIADW